MSAKQLNALFKKNKVHKCNLIGISAINSKPDNLMVMVDTPDIHKTKLTDEDRTNEEWIAEFAAVYPTVFEGGIDSLPQCEIL